MYTAKMVGSNATRYPLYYSSKRILGYKGVISSTKSFSFHAKPGIGWDSSTSFLLKFLQGLVGENLVMSMRVKAFVDDLYIVAELRPDPPGEPEWGDEASEENEGFGIIEFNVREQSEKQ